MNSSKVYIILTGVHERKVFDLYNIFRRNHRQYELLLFDYKDTSFSLPVVYTQKINKLPNDSYEHFETALSATLEPYKGNTLIYIPLLDNYNSLFYSFIEKHPGVLTYAMPSWDDFSTCINKIRFQQFCESHGLPVPRAFGKKDIDALKQHFIPLIIKPNIGSGSVDISFINTADELTILEKIDTERYLVQERIPNINVEGAFFLMDKGKLVSYYGHKRIRVFPETGGVTVFSSYHHNEQLKNIGADLLGKLNWHGVAMVEFLYDAAKDNYKIIEVNPRLWGSFLLSEFAHTGFTENYCRLCLQLPPVSFEHRTDTFIRWFYPFDILLYLKSRGRITGFWRMDWKHTCYINYTYAGFLRAVVYMVYFTCNINSFKRFFKKMSPARRQR